MRFAALLVILGACTDGPSVQIIVPLDNSTVVASVELRCRGHNLTSAHDTEILLDGQHYSDLIENTLPANCDSCNFVISFAGASITNGTHTIGIDIHDATKPIASDQITLNFQR